MTSKETLKERFIKNNTTVRKDGSVRMLKCFREKYGEMSVDDAFELFYSELERLNTLHDKVDAFERFLYNEYLEGRCTRQQSNISESRYYTWNSVKYRFSRHYYPTGSMTADFGLKIVDLCANPELIETIKY